MINKLHINCTGLYKIFKVSDLEVVALRGVDLDIGYGELISIVGASGSGKSTLLNILAGYESPSAGNVQVGDFDLLGINQKEAVEYRKSEVGFVWQQTGKNLVPYLDIYSNIELPMMASNLSRSERKERVDGLIEFLNLNSVSSRLPENISGGEQQVSAIAVALANQPPLLLADEPTGELDDETSAMVLEKMRYVNENYGTTVVIVTHDPKIEDHVNRSIGMRDGKVVKEVIRKEKKKSEFVVIDSFGGVQIPQEILSKSKIESKASLTSDKSKISLNKIIKKNKK
ncbi:MAG: ABC transporter [Dehalococcoidia bacterium]|nr:ABC transporter [Dehalococcoidia bacterium]MEC7921067.1 ABC transporter ATP-binding protein [Chloroflexota bacterium]MEC9451441.1 ABC transporter ATP-binding protein [Chloroflexota bacterium]MQG04507.1 ABC transporter ATP-binding protein [SAR202 cluster bacterium]